MSAILTLAAISFPVAALSQVIIEPSYIDTLGTIENGYQGFAVEDYVNPGTLKSVEAIDYSIVCDDRKFFFISDKIPSASNRRVIITNVTDSAFVKPLPYTDREYEQDNISEKIEVAYGSSHDDYKFIVTSGKNNFEYQVVEIVEEGNREIKTVVGTGSFSITVEFNRKQYDYCKETENYDPQYDPSAPGYDPTPYGDDSSGY